MNKKFLAIAAIAAFLVLPANSQEREPSGEDFSISSMFTDHMVFQRETSAPVWGWAAPGTKVTVSPSWDGVKYACIADESGRWEVKVATPEAGGPYSVTVKSGKNKTVLEDVLVGEVWLCTGQSNMEMPVGGFGSQPVEGSLEAILEAPEYSDRIRAYTILTDKEYEPKKNAPAKWECTDGEVTERTSAVAYFFAKRLTKALGVPVGLIISPWGGCMLQPWMTLEYVEKAIKGKIPEETYQAILDAREEPYRSPVQIGTMYNARMSPVFGYALKGFLWYQGCSNMWNYEFYDLLQQQMVQCWRDKWGDTDNKMPFYFVTIASYNYGMPENPVRGYFVENQLHSLDIIPNSGAAVTQGLGDFGCIHPAKKQEVATQLALLAIEKTYGMKSGVGSGFPYPDVVTFPSSSSVKTGTINQSGFAIDLRKGKEDDSKIVIHFTNAKKHLGNFTDLPIELAGFEVAGPDKVFHPVKAICRFDCVIIDCPEIADPVAVRYAFHCAEVVEPSLASTFGIPVPSFRTDDWKM